MRTLSFACKSSAYTVYMYVSLYVHVSHIMCMRLCMYLSAVQCHSPGLAELEGVRFGIDLLPVLGEDLEGLLLQSHYHTHCLRTGGGGGGVSGWIPGELVSEWERV